MQIGRSRRALASESVCGDSYLVLEEGKGALIALVDGLGHGPEAAKASEEACRVVAENAELPLVELMTLVHEEIRHTRGAAMTLLRIDERGALRHVAVGNVELVSNSAERIRPITLPGIVGSRLRKVIETRFQLHAGDVIAVHSDGIHSRFDLAAYSHLDAQRLAERLIEDWSKDHDDASCVVVTY